MRYWSFSPFWRVPPERISWADQLRVISSLLLVFNATTKAPTSAEPEARKLIPLLVSFLILPEVALAELFAKGSFVEAGSKVEALGSALTPRSGVAVGLLVGVPVAKPVKVKAPADKSCADGLVCENALAVPTIKLNKPAKNT